MKVKFPPRLRTSVVRTSQRGELTRFHRMLALVEHASHAVTLRENKIIHF